MTTDRMAAAERLTVFLYGKTLKNPYAVTILDFTTFCPRNKNLFYLLFLRICGIICTRSEIKHFKYNLRRKGVNWHE